MDTFPEIRIPFSVSKIVEWKILKSEMIGGAKKRRTQWVRPKHRFVFRLDALADYGNEEADKIYNFFLAQMGGLRAFKFFFPTDSIATINLCPPCYSRFHIMTSSLFNIIPPKILH